MLCFAGLGEELINRRATIRSSTRSKLTNPSLAGLGEELIDRRATIRSSTRTKLTNPSFSGLGEELIGGCVVPGARER